MKYLQEYTKGPKLKRDAKESVLLEMDYNYLTKEVHLPIIRL